MKWDLHVVVVMVTVVAVVVVNVPYSLAVAAELPLLEE